MAGSASSQQGPRLALALAVALLLLVAAAFAFAFTAASLPESAPMLAADIPSAATEAAAALDAASSLAGEALIESYQCSICHIQGAGRVAPSFIGIGERAAKRRPQMTAAQYLYESIVSPGVYLVDGYANAMPANFARRLTQAEIAHIIAYLLSSPADPRQ